MHTTVTKGATFHHNDDYSGHVDVVEVGPKGEQVNLANIPMTAVETLLAEKYRKLLIGTLQDLDLEQPGSLGKIVRLWGNARTMLRVY
jgi:hypothetical protein